MSGNRYAEISGQKISRGYNVNAAALPPYRFVGGATSANSDDAVDALSVTGVGKIKGLTQSAIAPGTVGDIYEKDGMVLPVETDGSAVIAIQDKLTVDATTGRVKTATNPTTGNSVEIVGEARSAATATAGEQLMMVLRRYTLFA